MAEVFPAKYRFAHSSTDYVKLRRFTRLVGFEQQTELILAFSALVATGVDGNYSFWMATRKEFLQFDLHQAVEFAELVQGRQKKHKAVKALYVPATWAEEVRSLLELGYRKVETEIMDAKPDDAYPIGVLRVVEKLGENRVRCLVAKH